MDVTPEWYSQYTKCGMHRVIAMKLKMLRPKFQYANGLETRTTGQRRQHERDVRAFQHHVKHMVTITVQRHK